MVPGVSVAINKILLSSDRNHTSTTNCHTNSFHDRTSEFSQIDLPSPNLQHTWSNFRAQASCSRIYRIFVTKEWMEKLSKTHLKGQPRPVSDHVPLMIDINHPKGGPTPFRFENLWLQHKEFKQNIQEWWDVSFQVNWTAQKINLKLRSIKFQLKLWNKKVSGYTPQLKENLTAQISLLDAKESETGLIDVERNCR